MYGCLPLLLFGIVFIFFSALIGLLRLLFGVRRTARAFRDAMGGGAQQQTRQGRHDAGHDNHTAHAAAGETSHRKNGKFFDRNEGEYVDFEEVK